MKTLITIILLTISLIGSSQNTRTEYLSTETSFIQNNDKTQHKITQDVTIVIDESLMIIKVTRDNYEPATFKILAMDWHGDKKVMVYVLNSASGYSGMYLYEGDDKRIMFLPADKSAKEIFYFNLTKI